MIDLHKRADPIVSGVIGTAAEFAKPIARLRNDLIHTGTAARPRRDAGREMLRLTEQMTFLLSACLLQDLGFDELSAIEATRRSRRFRLLTEVLR